MYVGTALQSTTRQQLARPNLTDYDDDDDDDDDDRRMSRVERGLDGQMGGMNVMFPWVSVISASPSPDDVSRSG
jgi:hypothetical protein